MSAAMWDSAEVEPDDVSTPARQPAKLVSLHFLRSALRRRRLACAFSALIGLLLATAFLVLVPAPHTATATLVLAHDPGVDPAIAMATDVSLATTRTVAARTISTLNLRTNPIDLLKNVSSVATTSDVLTLTVKAESDDQALRIVTAFTAAYLEFRADQLSAQTDALVAGMDRRVTKLQSQIGDLTQQINLATVAGDSGSSKLSDLISQRAQLSAQISTLQQSAQDATLKTTSLVASSRTIDAPAVTQRGSKRRPVLALASGLIGGTAVGIGVILFAAITSDRLRRRVDVAVALETTVPVSVGRLAPVSPLLRNLPPFKRRNARREIDRQRIAHVIESSIPTDGDGQWLAVGCVDNADEVRFAVAECAMALQTRGLVVRLVDLTEQGKVNAAVERLRPPGPLRPTVSRPRGVPSLATEIGDIETYGPQTREIPMLGATDVFIAVADLHPAIGADHLTAWTHRVVVAVTAGRSSAERVRTAGDLVRAAGLELWGAVLVRAEATDSSSGTWAGGEVRDPEEVSSPAGTETVGGEG